MKVLWSIVGSLATAALITLVGVLWRSNTIIAELTTKVAALERAVERQEANVHGLEQFLRDYFATH